ncbi:MAG: hypothetical protein FWG98_05355 [Candidatus Cloacimonetes bacterium]|nr:hypothetical protein [Candidatus Cloacimonadota bacterium]
MYSIRNKVVFITIVLFFILVQNIFCTETSNETMTKKISLDSFSIYPLWFAVDLRDVNHIARSFLFDEIYDSGRIMLGADIMLRLENNYVLGFIGAFGQSKQKVTVIRLDELSQERKLNYTIFFTGANLGRKYYLNEKIEILPSLMVGYGEHRLQITSMDLRFGLSGWDDLDFFLDFKHFNATILKQYTLIQPKFEANYGLTKNINLNTELGYMIGLAINDWTIINTGHSQELVDAPNTSFNGLTLSIGMRYQF